jgi:DNA-binding transcriptional LysR family regulator
LSVTQGDERPGGLGKPGLFRGGNQRSLTDEGNTLMEQIRTAFNSVAQAQRRGWITNKRWWRRRRGASQ